MDGEVASTTGNSSSKTWRRGYRRSKSGRGTGGSTHDGSNLLNEDGTFSSNRNRNPNAAETPNRRNEDPSQFRRRNKGRGGMMDSASCSGNGVYNNVSDQLTEDVTQKRHFAHVDRRNGNRRFSLHRPRGDLSSQPSGSVFNPYAPPFVPKSASLIAEQPVTAERGPRDLNVCDSHFLGRNQKCRGSKQNMRGGTERHRYEGQENHRNQERYRIDGSRKAYQSRENLRKQVESRQRRVKNDVCNQEESMRGGLIQQLENRCYECAICCQVILPKQGIWSCKTCYQMFHISGGCIINWAKKSKEDDNRWRCPTCQTKYEEIPYNYFCFCRKQRNPPALISEIPHSCGNICGGKRAPSCPHPCNEPCHPGPCPECPVMLVRSCNCGNVQKAVRCGSAEETKCNKVCDRLLACGTHRCTRVCHEGHCSPCEVVIQQSCFCGSVTREILCCEKVSDKYPCGSPCAGMYTCGVHRCTRNCHLTGDSGCGSCPYSPERITHCPCGRCTLKELGVERLLCLDSIPTCKNMCGKVLKCGGGDGKNHRCRSKCHTGECPPCDLNTSIICRCKQERRTLTCVEYVQFKGENEFLCTRRCKKRKSCGIHKCQELCCIQSDHFCLQICNKRLSCGLHFCESICHAGQCPRCLNASFEEQFCHCGRTMRPPPVPCGSPLPECNEPCARPHQCSHPVMHRCHGEERCPPCTVLVERMCYGNHEIRKNIPCHIDAVSCGRLCGKPLTCKVHYCNRSCHAGNCIKEGEKCCRPCTVLRRPCEHPCALPCHGSNPCQESECQSLVNVTCECGRRKSQMKCSDFEKIINRLRAVDAEENEGDQNLAVNGIGAMRRSASMEKLNCMSCDDECKKLIRNKKIAEAFELVTNADGDLEKEPTITFTEYLKCELRSNGSFVTEVELAFLELLRRLRDPTYLGTSLNHNFPPMSLEKRRFIHEYAEFFSFSSVSVDDPPKRSVILTAKRGISRAPLVLLTTLQKHPGVLNMRGLVTLNGNINDEAKKKASADEIKEDCCNGSSMKILRGSRPVKKRVAPQIAIPPPLPQFNHFAVLISDDESDSVPAAPVAEGHSGTVHEKDLHWWSDEDDVIAHENPEIASLMEELVLKVCKEITTTNRTDEENCKDSWSDDERDAM